MMRMDRLFALEKQ